MRRLDLKAVAASAFAVLCAAAAIGQSVESVESRFALVLTLPSGPVAVGELFHPTATITNLGAQPAVVCVESDSVEWNYYLGQTEIGKTVAVSDHSVCSPEFSVEPGKSHSWLMDSHGPDLGIHMLDLKLAIRLGPRDQYGRFPPDTIGLRSAPVAIEVVKSK